MGRELGLSQGELLLGLALRDEPVTDLGSR
jgi:hypothetical protein